MSPPHGAFALWFASAVVATAGLYSDSWSPGNVPWLGGIVPYIFDPALTVEQRATYLAGLQEYELAANIHFIPRTSETDYVLFKYNPAGPNRVSGSQPQLVEVNKLSRGQICHEMGHALGLEHEHQRPDRDGFVEVIAGNIIPGNEALFAIASGVTSFGTYDFESVMHYGRDTLSTAPGLDTLQAKPGFTKYQSRMGNVGLSRGDRALMAFLYGPPVVTPSAVVTTTADGGPGSFRAALYHALDHPGTTVTFNIPFGDPGHEGGVFTIKPTAYLPPLATAGTIIDGSTQPGYNGKPLIFFDGSLLPDEEGDVPGLLFYEANCQVKSLGFKRFPWVGLAMLAPDASGNTVTGCWIGIDAAEAAAPNAKQGIQISDGARGNQIGGPAPADSNVLSGNGEYGMWISGAGSEGNRVIGNRIGTNASGNGAVANELGGIIVTGAAHHQIIGPDNLISGNESAGIWLTGEGVDHNEILENRIGTNAAGSGALPNGFAGIYVISGASENLISGNLLSGNFSEGLRIAGEGSSGNLAIGNRAGTNAAGSAALPNGFAGITVLDGASGNRVESNVLSGNNTVGLVIADPGTSGNTAARNRIGTNESGSASIPNGFSGVYLTGGCSGNFLGDGPGSGNLISGNGQVGVLVADAGTQGNFIRNNQIGPDASGGTPFTHQLDGVRIQSGAKDTMVGGVEAGAANTIRGNSGRGIALFDAATQGHGFSRNSISGNAWEGIGLYDGSNHAQSAPVIASANLGSTTVIGGSFSGEAGASYRIEFFSSPANFPSAGRDFAGESLISTDGSGHSAINASLPAPIPAGRYVTATATHLVKGSSSAFSNAVAVTSTDADNDGLPDSYESTIPGLSPANPADATGDLDGDGISNLDEFLAGTSPLDPLSRLVVAGRLGEGGFLVSFPSVAGKIYRLESSATLTAPWNQELIHLKGSGGLVEIALPLPENAPRHFFRVGVGE